jgi:glutathione S-transferase kappa 1
LRALHYIKRNYPLETFLTTIHYLFHCFWGPGALNLTQFENVAKAISMVPAGFKGAPHKDAVTPLFSKDEVEAIMSGASSDEMKDLLKTTTQEALDRGAFGAPWWWVTNDSGASEPFFGSDR